MSIAMNSCRKLILLGAVGVLGACAGPQVLKEPHGAKVNQVALVTVYSNRGVSKMDQGGSLGGLTAIASLVKSTDDSKKEFGGNALSEYAVESFESEFGKVQKWRVMPAKQVLSSSAYQNFVAKAPTLYYNDVEKNVAKVNFVTGEKMIYLPGEGRDKRSVTALSELAKSLGVDAVAVLQMDMKYDLSTGVGSSGTAVAKVGLSMVMVNQNGDVVMDTPAVSGKNAQTPYRVPSGSSVPMLAGAIMLDSNSESMFKDSIRRGMTAIRDNVDKDLVYFSKK